MSLQKKLDKMHASVIERVPELAASADADTARLVSEGIDQKAIHVGERAPDFELPDQSGRYIQLARQLKLGPVIISFYRGGWCPYCNLELRALQQIMPKIEEHHATVLAISPQLPDHSLTTADKNSLLFPVLSDRGNKVARKFGLVFSLSDFVRPTYEAINVHLPELNGDESYELPLPGTFVLDKEGIIRAAFVNADYKTRMEPELILNSLKAIENPGN